MILFLLILIPAGVYVWKRIYRKLWYRGLDAELHFTENTVYAGEKAELTEVVSNRKRIPLSAVEIGFRIQKGVQFLDAENIVTSDFVYKRDIFSLRGMEAVTRRYHLECLKRGRYQISQVMLRTWSLLHVTQYEMEAYPVGEAMRFFETGTESTDRGSEAESETARAEELTVYARRVDVSGILALCDTILGTAESSRRLYEDPFAFASIREYSPRDPMKNINWKASARMGGLMANTYSSVRSEQFFIFLDVDDNGIWKEEELLETCISTAATLCQKLIRKGLEIGMAVNLDPPVIFEPKRGQEQLREIERFLTNDFSKAGMIPLEELAGLQVKNKDRICVYITKELKPEREERLRSCSIGFLPSMIVEPVRENGFVKLKIRRCWK